MAVTKAEARKIKRKATDSALENMDNFQFVKALNERPKDEVNFVHERLSEDIIVQMEKSGIARRFSTTRDLTGLNWSIPILKSLVPIVQHRPRFDASAQPAIDPKVTASVELSPTIDYVSVALSNDLNEDGPKLLQRLIGASVSALAAKEDQNAFMGDESQDSAYQLGICRALRASSIHYGGATAADLTIEDFLKTQAKLPEFAGDPPRWFMSRSAFSMTCLRLFGSAAASMAPPSDGDGDAWFLNHRLHFIPGMPGPDATTGDVVAVFGHLGLATAFGYSKYFQFQSVDNDADDTTVFRVKQESDFRCHDRGSDNPSDPAGSIVGLKLVTV